MPVFLTVEAEGEWLTCGKLEPEQKDPPLEMIGDASTTLAAELETYAVERKGSIVPAFDRTAPWLVDPLVAL